MTSPVLSSELFAQVRCASEELESASYDVKTTCDLFEEQVERISIIPLSYIKICP